jgi:hypothetical protein
MRAGRVRRSLPDHLDHLRLRRPHVIWDGLVSTFIVVLMFRKRNTADVPQAATRANWVE